MRTSSSANTPSGQTRYPTLKPAYPVQKQQKPSKELGRINKFQDT